MATPDEPKLGDLGTLSARERPRDPGRPVRIAEPSQARERPAEVAESPKDTTTGNGRRLGRVRYLTHLGASITVPVAMFATFLDPLHALYERDTQLALGLAVLTGVIVLAWQTYAGARRAHDRGHGGWVGIGHILPGINLLLIAYLALFAGTRGDNRFGSKPRGNGVITWLAYLVFVVIPFGLAPAALLQYDSYLQDRKASATTTLNSDSG